MTRRQGRTHSGVRERSLNVIASDERDEVAQRLQGVVSLSRSRLFGANDENPPTLCALPPAGKSLFFVFARLMGSAPLLLVRMCVYVCGCV